MSYRATSLIAPMSALVVAVLLAWPQNAQAALIKVNERCSLEEAIQAANSGGVVGDCLPGSTGQDIIAMFKPGKLTSVFPDDTGTPTITTDIIIKGNGLSIYRGLLHTGFRLFNVASTGSLRIESARLFEGSHPGLGGAIHVEDGGRLELFNCIVEDSFAGIAGGAIATGVGSRLDVIATTFRNNTADAVGGALLNRGPANLTVVTFEGNHSDLLGGAVLNTATATLSMFRSTLRHNTGGESIVQNRGDLIMTASTFVDNSGDEFGIHNLRNLTLNDCRVENNVFDLTPDAAAIRNDDYGFATDTYIDGNTPRNCSGTVLVDGSGNSGDPACY